MTEKLFETHSNSDPEGPSPKSQVLEYIDKNKDNIRLALFRKNGYTFYGKNAHTTGHSSTLTPELLEAFNKHNIPLVDATQVEMDSLSTAIKIPMVSMDGGDAFFEFPFSGMSYAPPEIVASLYEKAGATVHNIETVNMVSDMFRTKSNKLQFAREGYLVNVDMDKIERLDPKSGQANDYFPGGEELSGTRLEAFFNELADSHKELRAKYQELSEHRRLIPFPSDEAGKAQWRELQDAECHASDVANHISSALAKTGYEASLVIAGNKTEKEALAEAKAWSKNMISANLKNYQDRGLENSKDEYGYLYEALKGAKAIIDRAQSLSVERSPG